jgi:hypothetical protein
LANVVKVKKKNDKWKMCTDFTDLNKYCLKDDFPLSRIDKVVDSATGCETMALLDNFMVDNTSVISDEVLSYRLELIPLDADPRLFEYISGIYCSSFTFIHQTSHFILLFCLYRE